MLFVWVPDGCYLMGCGDWDDEGLLDEKPVHEVCLDGFWIGKFAVTVGQYIKFPKDTGSHFPHWLEEGSKYNISTGTDDLYKKLGLAGSFKQFGHLEYVADDQAESQGKQDVRNAPLFNKRLLGYHHGHNRDGKNNDKARDVILQIIFHEDAADKGQNPHGEAQDNSRSQG